MVARSVLACEAPEFDLTPLAPPPAACAIGGCTPKSPAPSEASACSAPADSPCGDRSPSECTRQALSTWGESQDDRVTSCVVRMLGDACTRGDAQGCSFAGRAWIDGRGVERDSERGLAMLVQACDAGVARACALAVRWLAEPTHARDRPNAFDLRARLEVERACLTGEPGEPCFEVGRRFYFGRNAFPRDRVRAREAYERGCNLGDSRACNNLGDALAYGEGVERDVARSAATFERACHLGEALGCANLGHMFERGTGVRSDRGRARSLFRAACATGEVYGCLHAEMLEAEDRGVPRDPAGALAFWSRACARADARACAFVGVIYEDGPDDLTRDTAKSIEAMNRGCHLGSEYACTWVKMH